MVNKNKMYVVNRDMSGKLISGHCAGCGRIFQFEDTPDGRRVEKAFETHECKREDVSETGARIDPAEGAVNQ